MYRCKIDMTIRNGGISGATAHGATVNGATAALL